MTPLNRPRAIGPAMWCVLGMAAAGGPLPLSAVAQTIHAVPVIPGGSITRVYAVNANGTAAAGFSDDASSNDRAIRWTLAGGTQNMGLLPGGVFNSYARAIDSTGTILAGYGDTPSGTRAFRWTTSGGYQILPFASGTSGYAIANGISGNGNVIAGSSGLGSGANGFTWDLINTPSGVFNICGGLGAGNAGLAVSDDGLTIVGTCGTSAVRRTYFPNSVLSPLTPIAGQQWAMAEAVSANGAIITGRYMPSTGGEFGFRYGLSVPGFIQPLPQTSNGCTALRPRGVNGDGTLIVGQVVDNVAGFTGFVWTPAMGSQLIATHLQGRAVNLTGWTISDVTAVSPDGSAMCGQGIFNGQARGWVARNLPCASINNIGAIGDNGCVGGGAFMQVGFSWQVGSSPTLRWFKNGVQLSDGVQPSGAVFSGTSNSATLNMSNLQFADAGSYTVGVSLQGACEVFSTPVVFNGPAALAQNVNPNSTTVCLGQNPFFFAVPSAPAIPPSSVTYRWQRFVGPLPTNWVNLADGASGNGSTYFGTGTSTFSILSAQAADGALYRCVFGVLGCGAASQINSGTAQLTVIDSLPAINGPYDTSGCPGDNDAYLSVSASPCVGCTYQWQKYTPCPFINCFNDIYDGPTGNGGSYGGTQTPNLVVAGLYPGDFTQYRCIITMPCAGAVASGEATIFPTPEAIVTSGPTTTAGCPGLPGSLAITATPPGSTYQWQKYVGPCILCWQNIANGPTGNGGNFGGAQSPTLIIDALNILDTVTSYRCIVTGPCGLTPAASPEGTFAILTNPVIQSQPIGGLVCTNGSKTLSVTLAPGNYGTVTYQWWRYVPAFPIYVPLSNGPLPSSAIVAGAQTPTLSLSNLKQQDAGQYYCMVSGCNNIPSSAVTLTWCPADFDCSGALAVADIFAFLNAWFAGAPSADFDGVNGLQVADIFAFLNAWFAGC